MARPARHLFALIALMLCALAQPAVAVVLVDEASGMTIPLPKGWFVARSGDFLNPREVEFGNAQIQNAVRSYRGPLPQAILKYKEPYPDLNPGIQFQTVAKPAAARGMDEAQFLAATLLGARLSLNQGAIVKHLSYVTVGGRKAAHGAFDYAFTYKGRAYPARAEMWAFDVAGRVLIIAASTRRDEANGTMKELKGLIARITFPKAR